MNATVNPAAPGHLPSFITQPGGADYLMVVVAIILVGAVLGVGLLLSSRISTCSGSRVCCSR